MIIRPNSDLCAVARFTRASLDFHDAIGDFGNFKLKESLDETRVRTGHHDLWTLRGLANFDDVRLDARVRLGTLVRHLLRLGKQCLDLAEVKQCVAVVGLLDDASDDVAFTVRVFLKLAVTLDFADLLPHHLAEGLRGDTTEFFLLRRVVALVDPVAVIIEVVCGEAHVQVLRVDLNDHFIGRAGTLFVGSGKCFHQHLQQGINGNAAVGGEHAYCFGHIKIAHDLVSSVSVTEFSTETFVFFFDVLGSLPGFGAGPQTKTVFARST